MKKGPSIFLALCLFFLLFPGCVQKQDATQEANMKNIKQLIVESDAFGNNETIPDRYTCNGLDINPPLSISGIPDDAKTLALLVEDPDAPSGLWVHWILWNMRAVPEVREGMVPQDAVQGVTSDGENKYHGPCPPPGRAHRYMFKAYALDTSLDMPAKSRRQDLEKAMQGHILAQGTLTGLYGRK